MAWFSYCQECGVGVGAPTAREDLIDGKLCSNGHKQKRRYSIEEWIAIIYENLEAANEA